jgi:biotin carboxylase
MSAPDPKNRVLLLMPSNTYHAADFIAAAGRLGIEVSVGTDRSQAFQDRQPAATLTLDFTDVESATAAIGSFAGRYPLQGVVGADDEATVLAASAAAALGLPHNPPAAVAATRDKPALRRALHDAGLPSPGYRVIRWKPNLGVAAPAEPVVEPVGAEATGKPVAPDPNAAAEGSTAGVGLGEAVNAALAEGIDFPCVLKPTFLSASRGVIRADDVRQFRAAAARIDAILDDPELRGRSADDERRILVEDYIPGDELALEGMLAGGDLHVLALFDKPDPLEGPYFEETIYVTPSRAGQETQRQAIDTVSRAVAALGLREGPLHAELRVNERGAFIIDLAARSIGGLCARVLRFGTGVSLEELILRHALGEDFASFRRERAAAGVMMIPIPRGGVLRSIEGLDAARNTPGIDEVTMTINRGQRLVPLPEGNRYLGFIFARDATPAGAEATLREAHARLRFEID